MKTLVYVGANVGVSLWSLFDKFDQVYVFEPDPEMFSELKRRFNQFEWVTLVNAACSNKKGTAKFYVTGNRVASGLGESSEAFQKVYGSNASTLKEITVDTINLGKYLESEGVDFIDLYYSDCQGSDLTILKTMKKFIDNKKIGETFIETHADGSEIYVGLNNQFSGFKKLLNKNYDFIHAAMGTYQASEAGPARLKLNGQYASADELENVSEWGVSNPEWDSYWKLKGHPEGLASTLRA